MLDKQDKLDRLDRLVRLDRLDMLDKSEKSDQSIFYKPQVFQIYKISNLQVFKFTSFQIYKFSNLQVFFQIYKFFFKFTSFFSNLQVFKFTKFNYRRRTEGSVPLKFQNGLPRQTPTAMDSQKSRRLIRTKPGRGLSRNSTPHH